MAWLASTEVRLLALGVCFFEFFSSKQPNQRTMTHPILAGSESRKTVLPGQLPGLLLLRVHTRKELEKF